MEMTGGNRKKKERSSKVEESSVVTSGDDARAISKEGASSLNYVDQSLTSSKRCGSDSSKSKRKSEKVSVHNADQQKRRDRDRHGSDFSKPKRLEEVNTDRAVEILPVISTSDLGEKYVEAKQNVTREKRDRDSKVKKLASASGASGIVSTDLEEYVKWSRDLSMWNGSLDGDRANVHGKMGEEQICEMLGEKPGVADVRDASGQSRHDVGKPLVSFKDMNRSNQKNKKHRHGSHASKVEESSVFTLVDDASTVIREAVKSLNDVDQSLTSSKLDWSDSPKLEKKSSLSAILEEANGHCNRAAGIIQDNMDQPVEMTERSKKRHASDSLKLRRLEEAISSDQAVETLPVSSASSLREKYAEDKQDVLRGKQGRGSKAKKVVFSSGILPTAIGKEYLKEGSLASGLSMCNRISKGANVCGKKVEEQIREMRGEKHWLADVRDGTGQSRHGVGKFADSLSDCPSQSSESKHHDNPCRNHLDIPSGEPIEFNVSQEVVEYLFNISRGPHHEARPMDWSRIGKKMKLFGNDFESHKETVAKGDECKVFRKESQQYLELKRSSCQKAEVAYCKGKKELAAYHSDEAKKYSKMHQQAEKKASWDTFIARNKNIRNDIKIDLHGQRVEEATGILKVHLSLPSIKTLRVITGRGLHCGGKSHLKESVIGLLKDEGIGYSMENAGLVVIELDQRRNFKFQDAESDGN